MGDLRLNEWINIFLWLLGLGGSMIAVVLLLIVWPQIVSIVSSVGGRLNEEGRARRAYRQRVYNMSSTPKGEPVPGLVPRSVPVPSTAATKIDLVFLASNLTEAQYIELGARLRDRRGKYVFSGKKLYTLAGGNHDEFLANMRRWQGGQSVDDEPVHVTPIVGRPTSAQFETDRDFPYQAPA